MFAYVRGNFDFIVNDINVVYYKYPLSNIVYHKSIYFAIPAGTILPDKAKIMRKISFYAGFYAKIRCNSALIT